MKERVRMLEPQAAVYYSHTSVQHHRDHTEAWSREQMKQKTHTLYLVGG